MADLNRVLLIGRLTFDPELRRIASGKAVTELRMAVNKNWIGKDGEKREEVTFLDVTVWDRQAENACQYLKKGSSVFVEGSLKMDQWEDKTTGEKRSKVKVQADRVQFLDPPNRDGQQGNGNQAAPQGRGQYGGARTEPQRQQPPAGRGRPAPPPGFDPIEDDDIPF